MMANTGDHLTGCRHSYPSWSPCPGMWVHLWQEHGDAPTGGILGTGARGACVQIHNILCLSPSASLVSHSATPASLLPPPAPGTHPGNMCKERLGLSEPEVGQLLGEPLVLGGDGERGCARRWRGTGLLVHFEMVLPPWAKGLLPRGPDPAAGGCVAAGCRRGERRVPTPHLWAGGACGVQVTLWV